MIAINNVLFPYNFRIQNVIAVCCKSIYLDICKIKYDKIHIFKISVQDMPWQKGKHIPWGNSDYKWIFMWWGIVYRKSPFQYRCTIIQLRYGELSLIDNRGFLIPWFVCWNTCSNNSMPLYVEDICLPYTMRLCLE